MYKTSLTKERHHSTMFDSCWRQPSYQTWEAHVRQRQRSRTWTPSQRLALYQWIGRIGWYWTDWHRTWFAMHSRPLEYHSTGSFLSVCCHWHRSLSSRRWIRCSRGVSPGRSRSCSSDQDQQHCRDWRGWCIWELVCNGHEGTQFDDL